MITLLCSCNAIVTLSWRLWMAYFLEMDKDITLDATAWFTELLLVSGKRSDVVIDEKTISIGPLSFEIEENAEAGKEMVLCPVKIPEAWIAPIALFTEELKPMQY